MNKVLTERIKILEKMAEDMNLDPYPINYEVVSQDTMLEVISYGLPTRARHWSYGQSYDYQKMQGEMGFSKVYEVVLNNNPSYAFLLDTNSDIANTMVIAHVIGHCFVGDTRVETTRGFVDIKSIVPGDMVLTHKGRYRQVIESRETKKTKDLVEIRVKGEESPSRCTPEHRLLIKRDNMMFWCEAKDVTENDLVITPKISYSKNKKSILIPIEVSRPTPRWKKELANKFGGYQVDLDCDFGRIIGLYIAEGSRNNTSFAFSLHKDEASYSDFIQNWFEKLGINTGVTIRESDSSRRVMVYDKSFGMFLEKECGRHSNNKFIPNFAADPDTPRDFMIGMIRGLFEGDGHIKGDKYQSSFTTTSSELAYKTKSILKDFGIKASIKSRSRKGRKTCYDLSVHGKAHRKLLEICDINFEKEINRTWSFSEQTDEHLFSKVTMARRVELLEEVPVYDIEVEEDHSFVIDNGMIAHNCHFFKNNYLFKKTDNKMVYHAAERAQRIEEYIQKYGIDAVERIMDIGFALDKHIDWHKGLRRSKYPRKKKYFKTVAKDEFSDLLDEKSMSKKMVVPKNRFPPNPEKDILWFLINYSNSLESWQVDILEIIREETYYFYPQYMTKIMNEGFASFVHAYLMSDLECINHGEHLDFCGLHEKVVQPGRNSLNINPYFLGFKIFTDIKERWDRFHEEGTSSLTGLEKVYKVVETEDDISFIRNYLTKELAQELKLFSYKDIQTPGGDRGIHITGTDLNSVVESLTKDLYNYRAPLIAITGIEDGFLQLDHVSKNIGTLDVTHAEKVMEYIYEAWRSPLNLETIDDSGFIINYTYDELGFSN